MKTFSQWGEQGNGCTLSAVFEVKKEIPDYVLASFGSTIEVV